MTLYSSTFIFAKGSFDAAFHQLDEIIAKTAQSLPGYLGEESWENPTTGLLCNVYYWDSMAALEQLMQHPAHREAKARQGQWLAGYQVVIAQVLATYGDGRIHHPLAGLVPMRGLAAPPTPGLAAPPA